MSEPDGKYPIGTFVEDRSDEEIGFISSYTADTSVITWLCDLDGGSWEWDIFGPDPERHRFRPVDDPKERAAKRFEDIIGVIEQEKLTHVFVYIWIDDGVPNVNVYQDIPDLIANAPHVSAKEAMRAVSEAGEPIGIGNERWLRFVLKG